MAKHKHVIDPNAHIVKIKTLILQKANDVRVQSIPKPHETIFGNVLVNKRIRSSIEITIKQKTQDFSRNVLDVRKTRRFKIAPITPRKNIGIPQNMVRRWIA